MHPEHFKSFIKEIIYLVLVCWVFVAAQALSLVEVSGGYSLIALRQLLTAVASPVAEH